MSRWRLGSVFTRRIQAMGIRDRPTSFHSPWQNGHIERLIGSIRRECTDHLIVLNEEHLRRILAKFSIITGLMFRSEKIHQTGARSSASGTSSHMQYWADCITGTHESSFWKRQSAPSVLTRSWADSIIVTPGLGFRYTQGTPGKLQNQAL
jgi:transposase InsO family protein